jgi:hypothetical protein
MSDGQLEMFVKQLKSTPTLSATETPKGGNFYWFFRDFRGGFHWVFKGIYDGNNRGIETPCSGGPVSLVQTLCAGALFAPLRSPGRGLAWKAGPVAPTGGVG